MKKINLLELSNQLVKKFKTVQVDANEPPMMLESNVVPTFDVQQSLVKPTAITRVVSFTGNGTYVAAAVPQNQKWKIEVVYVELTSGTCTFNRFLLSRNYYEGLAVIIPIYCGSQTAATNIVYYLPTKLVLMPNDTVAVNVNGFGGAGTFTAVIFAEIEDFNG